MTVAFNRGLTRESGFRKEKANKGVVEVDAWEETRQRVLLRVLAQELVNGGPKTGKAFIRGYYFKSGPCKLCK